MYSFRYGSVECIEFWCYILFVYYTLILNILFDYLNNSSPTGYESSGQQIWLDYIKNFTDTVYCIAGIFGGGLIFGYFGGLEG